METDYDKWQEQQKSEKNPFRKILKNLTPIHFIVLGIVLLVGNWAVSSGKLNMSYFIAAIAVSIIGIIFFAYKQTGERVELPEHIVKEIVQKKLEAKKGQETGIPFDCTVKVMIQNNSIYKENWITGDSGAVRDVGFQIIRKGYKRTGVVGVNSFTGAINQIRWEPMGYAGKGDVYKIITHGLNVVDVPDNPPKK